MKIENVWIKGDFYYIMRDDGILFIQRRYLRSATDTPLRGDEKIIGALCEKIMDDEASYIGTLIDADK